MIQAFDTAPGAAADLIAAVHPVDLTCRPQLVPDDADSGIRRVLTAYAQSGLRHMQLGPYLVHKV